MLSHGLWQQETDVSRAEILHPRKEISIAIVRYEFKFRLYSVGKPFIVQTDHQRLTLLNDSKLKNGRILLWALAFQGYNYTVKDIPGKDNVMANYFSLIVINLNES